MKSRKAGVRLSRSVLRTLSNFYDGGLLQGPKYISAFLIQRSVEEIYSKCVMRCAIWYH